MIEIKKYFETGEGEPVSDRTRGAQEGHCLGIAKALSIILNPYDPDINEVRREAMRRIRDGA